MSLMDSQPRTCSNHDPYITACGGAESVTDYKLYKLEVHVQISLFLLPCLLIKRQLTN